MVVANSSDVHTWILISVILFTALFLVWKKSDPINLVCKLIFFAMAICGGMILFS